MGVYLATHTANNVDISSMSEVLNFTYVSNNPARLVACMTIGSVGSSQIAGGTYYPGIFINDLELLPAYGVVVGAGVGGFVVNTTSIVVSTNDVISLRLLGQPSDVSVHVTSDIIDIDSHSLTQSDIDNIISSMVDSLKHITLSNERAVLAAQATKSSKERIVIGPIRPCTRSFLLPK